MRLWLGHDHRLLRAGSAIALAALNATLGEMRAHGLPLSQRDLTAIHCMAARPAVPACGRAVEGCCRGGCTV
jgi:hypothetical protein